MANGKSLASSLSLAESLADVCRLGLPEGRLSSTSLRPELRPSRSTGGRCDIGSDNCITSQNSSLAGRSDSLSDCLFDYSPDPWHLGRRSSSHPPSPGREPNRLPEYPKPGADCPRIFCGAPASG